MTSVGYDVTVPVRIRHEVAHQIDEVVEALPDKYENRSHFFRCAVIRLLREEHRNL